jgi:S-adenosylmethionine synthetase
MMFGYACEETPELMPLPITLAHALTRRLSEVRKTRRLDYLRPDGKSQVTVRYEGDTPVGIEKVLISAQHREGAEGQIKDDLIETVIRPVMPDEFFDEGSAEILGEPDRSLRHRGAAGRHGPHGAQDHSGHLRRLGPARRRRLLRQGRHEGRPLGLLRGPLGRQEPRRRRHRRPLPGAGRLRHRGRPPGERDGRDLRDR